MMQNGYNSYANRIQPRDKTYSALEKREFLHMEALLCKIKGNMPHRGAPGAADAMV